MIHQELSIDWLPDSEIDKFAFQCSHLSCISCTLFFLSFLSHLLQTLFLPFQFCLSVRHIDRLDGKFEENRQIEIMIILQTKRKWNHLKTKIYPKSGRKRKLLFWLPVKFKTDHLSASTDFQNICSLKWRKKFFHFKMETQ